MVFWFFSLRPANDQSVEFREISGEEIKQSLLVAEADTDPATDGLRPEMGDESLHCARCFCKAC